MRPKRINTSDSSYASVVAAKPRQCWNPALSDRLKDLEDFEEDERIFADGEVFDTIDNMTDNILKDFGVKGHEFPNRKPLLRGSEVGDDRVDPDIKPRALARMLAVQEVVLKMTTSPEDTLLSTMFWNFCEVSSIVPTSPLSSYNVARRTNAFKNLDYIDSPVLRLIVDCSKSDRSHSSTNVGKQAMAGSRMSTPREEFREVLHLASLYQDAMLRTSHSPDPKYLPQAMGGSSVPAIFDNWENLYLYTYAYKGGDYQRVYGSATAELRTIVHMLEEGSTRQPYLCSRLRDRQEYLHGTYSNAVFVPTQVSMTEGTEMPIPLYESTEARNEYLAYENRLLRTKHLIGRRAAEIERDRAVRLNDILFGKWERYHVEEQEQIARRVQRRRFENALSANSAFKNLLDRNASPQDFQELLRSESFHTVMTGRTHFTKEDAIWLNAGGRAQTVTIDDIPFSEDMFVRAEVSCEESMKVSGVILRPPDRRGNITEVVTTTKVGLYQINHNMEDWAETLTAKLISMPDRPVPRATVKEIFFSDPEWVQDDTGLIAQCIDDTRSLPTETCVILVSTDRRLANQMAQQSNCNVHLVHPASMIINQVRELYDSRTRFTVEEVLHLFVLPQFLKRPVACYTDTGSLAAHSAIREYNDDLTHRVILVESGFDESKHRYDKVRVVTEEPLAEGKTYRLPKNDTFYPIVRPRLKRGITGGPESDYSSRGSWRRSEPQYTVLGSQTRGSVVG